ncbi:calnexin isoform X1 [Ciona intestinalis]
MWKVITLLLCFGLICAQESTGPIYVTPVPSGNVFIAEPFDSDDALESWTQSQATKEGVDSDIAKYNGNWAAEGLAENALPGDLGLVLKGKAKHHAIAAKLDQVYKFEDKPFIMQYEVNFQTGIECGGAYVKLLTHSEGLDLSDFRDKTPYTIMFGPDKCGEDYKLHFIFRHKNPKTGEIEEKHANKPTTDFKSYYTDKASHLYTLIINPDNSFQVLIDQTVINSGNLLTDFTPPVVPPKEIEDKDDKKPEDWDEREMIADPDATKPDDWDETAPARIVDTDAEMPEGWLEDEPLYIPDPDASMPEDWDEEMDGEWEAPKVDNPKCAEAAGCGTWEPPMIDNPDYKGIWSAPQIANPAYKGIWKPRMIPNPGYFEDEFPYKMSPIGAVGFELWSMSEDIYFDNILITDDREVADDYAEKTWKLKKQIRAEKEPSFVQGLLSATEEKPWLWIIYVLVVGLPAVLLFAFCCGGKKKEDPKKTDEPTPDDPHESENEDENDKEDEKEEDGEASQDENKGEASQEEEEAATEETGDGDKLTKEDLEKDDDDIQALEDDNSPVNSRRSPRKRKPRVQD